MECVKRHGEYQFELNCEDCNRVIYRRKKYFDKTAHHYCIHCNGRRIIDERRKRAIEVAHTSDEPLPNNKTTGIKNIYYNKRDASYDVEIHRNCQKVKKSFKRLEQALRFKYDVLEHYKNEGRLIRL